MYNLFIKYFLLFITCYNTNFIETNEIIYYNNFKIYTEYNISDYYNISNDTLTRLNISNDTIVKSTDEYNLWILLVNSINIHVKIYKIDSLITVLYEGFHPTSLIDSIFL